MDIICHVHVCACVCPHTCIHVIVYVHVRNTDMLVCVMHCSVHSFPFMHLSIVCPTSPCVGIGGAKEGFDCEVYFNPASRSFTEGSIPHFKGGS